MRRYHYRQIFLFLLFVIQCPLLIGQTDYQEALHDLNEHLIGNAILDEDDLADRYNIIETFSAELENNIESIEASFDLIDQFTTIEGPLFIGDATYNGFNRALADDGRNLHRAVMLVHQALLDYSYTLENITNYPDFFTGRYFETAHYFPGYVEGPSDPLAEETATIRCSYTLGTGTQPWAEIGNPNVIRPTGCYLAPGTLATVRVPNDMLEKGIKIRVGAHYWDLSGKGTYKRMDRVSLTYDITDSEITLGHPLGGGIYIEIPLGIDEGLQEIRMQNVVRSPFFSIKDFHRTSLEEWQNVERNRAAPWTDLETDKFMMQVPTSWMYNFDDPESVLLAWDKSMDVVSDLLGRPRVVDRHKNYLQFDVIIRGSAYHPGYPMSNTPYNPNDVTDGTPKNNILIGPEERQDIHFHELGHEVAISKFVGETEAIVNFLYVPVLNKCYGYSLDDAFGASFGPSYNFYISKDNVVKTRLVAHTFEDGIPRNTCSCTQNEVRYQHRGYAHYVDIVELFGWEALEDFWLSEGVAADAGTPYPVNNQAQDDRIFRMSQAAGVDLRPLFHFWGIIPEDQEALAALMQEHELPLSMCVKEKLLQYRELIPEDQDSFIHFGNELYPDFQNYSGTQFDFGAGWYQVNAENYDENRAGRIETALSDIIRYYYGTDCFDEGVFVTPIFDLASVYCQGTEEIPLIDTSLNDVIGNWSSEGIASDTEGLFSYVFSPQLDQCAKETDFPVEILSLPTPSIFTDNVVACSGESISLSTEDGYASIRWELAGMVLSEEQDVVVSESGLLHLFVTDEMGCEAENSIELTILEELSLSVIVEDASCFGGLGSADFEWSGGSGSGHVFSLDGSSLLPGDYTVTVTDDAGCMAEADFTILEGEPLEPYIDGELAFCDGAETILSSTDNYESYTWILDNEEIGTASSIIVDKPGELILVVEDTEGCLGESIVLLTKYDAIEIDVAVMDALCNGSVGSANFVASGGLGEGYIYSMDGMELLAGEYTLLVTDGAGCTGSTVFEISEPGEIDVVILGETIICYGEGTTLEVDGSYDSYHWHLDGELIGMASSLALDKAGEIYLEVFDDNGCSGEAIIMVEVLEPLEIDVETEDAICFGGLGSANFSTTGGTGGGYSYSIDGTALEAGEYTVIVTDEMGCTGSLSFEIEQASIFEPLIMGDNYICAGEQITLSSAENYESYEWSLNGEVIGQDPSIEISSGGEISLTVIDSNGCEGGSEIFVDTIAHISVMVETVDALCFGDFGSANFIASGGSGQGFSFSMDGDALEAGMYSVTATDDLGCMGTASFDIGQAEAIQISLVGGDIVVEGGTPPYEIASDTLDNEILVTVIDSNGCIGTVEFVYSEVGEIGLKNQIKLFPNPTQDKISIIYGSIKMEVSSIRLYDATGKWIETIGPVSELHLGHYEQGMYMLQFISHSGQQAVFSIVVL